MAAFEQYLIDRNDDGFIDDAEARVLVTPGEGIDRREFWSVLLDAAALLGLSAQALPLPLFVDAPVDGVASVRVDDVAGARGLLDAPAPEVVATDTTGHGSERSGDLLDLFTISGVLDDRDGDLVPDATRIGIALPEDLPDAVGIALCNLAVRIGLESGGVTIPLVADRELMLAVDVGDHAPRLAATDGGWRVAGESAGVAALIEGVAREWPHFGHPQTAGARAGLDLLARTLIGDGPPDLARQPVRWELEWTDEPEIARLQHAIHEQVFRRLATGSELELVAFTCESAPLRRELERSLVEEARQLGVPEPRIRVLSAFKVGLSWLEEVVLPDLVGEAVERLEIRYRRFEPAEGMSHLDMPIRWLQELFPGDEIAAAQLGIPLESVVMREAATPDAPVYEAVATDADGTELGRWETDLLWYALPFMPQVAGSELVAVTTGGFIATVNGEEPREQVATDLDRFWRFWQREVLARVVADIHDEGGFDAARQPFFGALEAEVTLSAPNRRLGIREENDSAAEALHEDIYFNTLDTLEVLGLESTGDRTSAPGAVIPTVNVSDGAAPHAVVRLREAPPRPPVTPQLEVDELRLVDGELVAAVRAPADLDNAAAPTPGVPVIDPATPSLAVDLLTERGESRVRLPLPVMLADDGDDALAPMDQNIHGTAVETWAGRVGRTANVSAWIEGHSYEERPIPAIAIAAEAPGRFWSPTKLTALKPTAMIVARHHANEISSTNAALKLAQLCGSDETWRELARALNIVLIPYENADGAALHARLAKPEEAATWKHHPARYNALGHEFGEDYFDPGTPYGEARVRPALWRRWLPDALVDNHGVPSHEWVQPFAGFGSPPRFRVSYWIPQALIYGIVRYVDDPAFPEHAQAARALRDAVSAAFVNTEIGDLNREIGASYRRWGQERVPDRFPGEFHNDMLWHFGGTPADPGGRGFNTRYPRTTVLSWVTEVNDETATGGHLETVATAHLEANRAMLAVLADLAAGAERATFALPDGSTLHRHMRKRPLGAG